MFILKLHKMEKAFLMKKVFSPSTEWNHCIIIYKSQKVKLKCPSTEELISKMWYIYTVEYNEAI